MAAKEEWATSPFFVGTLQERSNRMVLPEHVVAVLQQACTEQGVTLINANVRGQHKQLILDVFIDAPNGVTHEHCTAVSRYVDEQLLSDEFYDRLRAVEVSSPGAETPVKHLWQLAKHVGRTVRVVRTNSSVDEGALVSVSETELVLQPTTTKKEPTPPTSILKDEIKEAKVVIRL